MKRISIALLWMACAIVFPPALAAEGGPDARSIVEMAHAAAGGDSWRRPRTLHLVGNAVLHGDGTAASRTEVEHYEMWRVFPAWSRAAHGANGKFRLDARSGGALLFQVSFDGRDTWNQDGRMEQAAASREWSENFGFGIIRFALDAGFTLARMADDQVDGRAAWTVRVDDPEGGRTLFWIDQADHSVRKVAFDTPRGWHERIYSDFYMVDPPRFQQPGRVRMYYGGVLVSDIRWTRAEVDAPIADAVFVLDGR